MLLSSCSERNPIGRRTESDQTADGNGRGCSCLSCTNQANWQSIAAVSARLCRLPEQELHQPSQQNNLFQLSSLGFAACQSKNCTNQANDTNVGGYGIPAVVTQSSTQISFH